MEYARRHAESMEELAAQGWMNAETHTLLEPRDDMEWSSDSDDADKTAADAPKESGVDDDIVYHDEDEITARKVQAAARLPPARVQQVEAGGLVTAEGPHARLYLFDARADGRRQRAAGSSAQV